MDQWMLSFSCSPPCTKGPAGGVDTSFWTCREASDDRGYLVYHAGLIQRGVHPPVQPTAGPWSPFPGIYLCRCRKTISFRGCKFLGCSRIWGAWRPFQKYLWDGLVVEMLRMLWRLWMARRSSPTRLENREKGNGLGNPWWGPGAFWISTFDVLQFGNPNRIIPRCSSMLKCGADHTHEVT